VVNSQAESMLFAPANLVTPNAVMTYAPQVSERMPRDQMVAIAIAMFIALFGWGAGYFGWSDPDGKVQLALATCFILGIVSGYKVKSPDRT